MQLCQQFPWKENHLLLGSASDLVLSHLSSKQSKHLSPPRKREEKQTNKQHLLRLLTKDHVCQVESLPCLLGGPPQRLLTPLNYRWRNTGASIQFSPTWMDANCFVEEACHKVEPFSSAIKQNLPVFSGNYANYCSLPEISLLPEKKRCRMNTRRVAERGWSEAKGRV